MRNLLLPAVLGLSSASVAWAFAPAEPIFYARYAVPPLEGPPAVYRILGASDREGDPRLPSGEFPALSENGQTLALVTATPGVSGQTNVTLFDRPTGFSFALTDYLPLVDGESGH